MKYKLIQFILQELKNNPEDLERFDELLKIHNHKYNFSLIEQTKQYNNIEFIRTALSRKDGKAVLSGLEREIKIDAKSEFHFFELTDYRINVSGEAIDGVRLITSKTHILYEAFDKPLRNGSTLQKALEACEKYFEEEEEVIILKIWPNKRKLNCSKKISNMFKPKNYKTDGDIISYENITLNNRMSDMNYESLKATQTLEHYTKPS